MAQLPGHLLDKLPPGLPLSMTERQLRAAAKRARAETLQALTQRDMAERQLEAARAAVNRAVVYQSSLDNIMYELDNAH